MTRVELTILGKPCAKPRQKYYQRGKFIGNYNPKAKEQRDLAVIAQAKAQGIAGLPIHGAVKMDIFAYFPIPKATSKKLRERMEAGLVWHIKKPDRDNLEKVYQDAFNGIFYDDDRQIADGRTVKKYSDRPRVEITIEEME